MACKIRKRTENPYNFNHLHNDPSTPSGKKNQFTAMFPKFLILGFKARLEQETSLNNCCTFHQR